MSAYKIIWSSSDITKKHKLRNAKKINDISIQSLKFQILFFLGIITEMCLNLVLWIFRGLDPSMYTYMLICKTFLAINLVFIVCYSYQIIQARLAIYVEIKDNKTESILKCIIFELVPQLKICYDKLITYRPIADWLWKTTIEQERIKGKQEEERRKVLYKMYFPSLHAQFNSFGNIAAMREMCSPNDVMGDVVHQDYVNMSFDDSRRLMISMTPFPRRGSDPSLTQSHIHHGTRQNDRPWHRADARGDIRASFIDNTIVRYQPSPPSTSPRTVTYSPSSLLQYHHIRCGLLSEVPPLEVWSRLGIDIKNLDQWIVDFKLWIHGTILARIIQELERLKQHFVQLGINDVVLGESKVHTLRQVASQLGAGAPTLPVLINFLDCCKDQSYVVNRIRELAHGCNLSKFQWDTGSNSTRHPWKEHLPNDSVLILHLLSTYIDSRMPSNLHGVRIFSEQFIVDNIDNKDPSELKDICVLFQASVQPPHFKVIFDQMIYATPAGRRNLFECLIMFFYKVYRNEGNLKWLNLGRSGLNMNWIFDKKSQ